MCGIVGFVGPHNIDALKSMSDQIIHRGPDAGAEVILDEKVHLAHRRLSIIDLSPAGSQPMFSHDGNFCIVYNGEIYNYKDIKKDLRREWCGHSDTEVLLECISEYGLKKTLDLISGMFAFALYDLKNKKLILVRDRFGEKPLYFSKMNEHFFFGSELKGFVSHPAFEKKISLEAVQSFFKYNYIPAPLSIYQKTFKVRPAHFVELNISNGEYSETCYWKLDTNQNFSGDYKEAQDVLEKKLDTTVKEQMISDVSLGAFLSGGIDSSTVVALMQKNSLNPVKTFSIGFNEEKFNEAVFAKKIANHLGTEHTEMYISAQDALHVVPAIASIYDEPFSDSSQIPTYMVAALTKKHVTVALSGDAGDEVFGGYTRYLMAPKVHRNLKRFPSPVKMMASKLLKNIAPQTWDAVLPFPGDKIHKLASLLDSKNERDIYDRLTSHWSEEDNLVLGNAKSLDYGFDSLEMKTFEEKMMYMDTQTYLPDDILVKVDRAGMAVSLESRIPFLDHRVVQFAWSLPLEYKISQGRGKRIVRDLLYKHVPQNLIDRPKMGFGVPLDKWLRLELKDWAENLLDKKKIEEAGILNFSVIKQKWEEHQSGKHNWQYLLWDVLMFQDWYENSFIR